MKQQLLLLTFLKKAVSHFSCLGGEFHLELKHTQKSHTIYTNYTLTMSHAGLFHIFANDKHQKSLDSGQGYGGSRVYPRNTLQ